MYQISFVLLFIVSLSTPLLKCIMTFNPGLKNIFINILPINSHWLEDCTENSEPEVEAEQERIVINYQCSK